MKRARTSVTAALLAAAALGAGCSYSNERAGDDGFYYYAGGAGDGFVRHNVGFGDALGAAMWGTDITIAKAHQFGDTEFAAVDLGFED